MIIYTVKSGDTLFSIARRFGVPQSVLAVNNSLPSSDRLVVGQSIVIEQPTFIHTVKNRDTLYSIASRYGVTVNSLYRNNLVLQGNDLIYPGQSIIVSVEREPIATYQIGGYAYPFISPTLLNTSLPFMNYLIPFTYGFDRQGNLIMPQDGYMRERANAYNTQALLHLSTLDQNDRFSVENAAYLLNNHGIQKILLENIFTTLREKKLFGVDVDFEYLGKDNADSYAEFISFLRQSLNPYGYGVIVALAPKVSDTQAGQLYEGHDYKKLGEAANAVLCMTYEWGYTYGPPLAVSPVPNVRRVLDYAVSQIKSTKIFEGVSNYGYDFTLPYVQGESMATSVSTKRALEIAMENRAEISFDENAMAPYFYYSRDGKEHVVWFEDARSISARLKLIKEYNLKGGLYWNLNRENNQNLTVLNSLINRAETSLF